jgi:hypothetical protein
VPTILQIKFKAVLPFNIGDYTTLASREIIEPGNIAPICAVISPDGTKIYAADDFPDREIEQYTLTTPFDLSTIQSTPTELDPGDDGFSDFVRAFRFSNDGTKLFILFDQGFFGGLRQYTCSTPFDIGTATYDSVVFGDGAGNGSFQGNGAARGLEFDENGNTLFIPRTDGNGDVVIYAYNLGSPFNISSVTNGGSSSAITAYVPQAGGLRMVPGGEKVLWSSTASNPGVIYEHTLSTAYDLTSINPTPNASLNMPASIDRVGGVAVHPNGTSIYVADRDADNENDSALAQLDQ